MIYSPREKLQLLRKQYKISQMALVGNSISRSHLAMIETGKTKLSKKRVGKKHFRLNFFGIIFPL